VSPCQEARLRRVAGGEYSAQFAVSSRSRTCAWPSRRLVTALFETIAEVCTGLIKAFDDMT
jgi:hypothetical protein